MHVAVGCGETEFFLNLRSEQLIVLDSPGRFRSVAASPCVLKLVVRSPTDHVDAPELIDRSKVGEVVVGTVHIAQLVLHETSVGPRPLVASLVGSGFGAEGEAFFTVPPHGLVIGHDHFTNAPTMMPAPVLHIRLAITGPVSTPQFCARDVFPGRSRVGDVGERLFVVRRESYKEAVKTVVALTVGQRQIAGASVEDNAVFTDLRKSKGRTGV